MSGEALRELHDAVEIPPGWCRHCFEPHRCSRCHDAGRIRQPIPPQQGEDTASLIARCGRVATLVMCPECFDGPPGSRAMVDAVMSRSNVSAMETGLRGMVDPLYQDATLATWRREWNQSQREVAFAYTRTLAPARPILLLAGDKGAGKSHMAAVICNEFALLGKEVAFWPVIDLLDRYRATIAEDAPETVEMIDMDLRRAFLVVLDDFGAHNATGYASERLFRFIDERYRTRRPLVVTTNLAPEQLDERVVSRLCDVRLAERVRFTGDRRKQE